MRTIRQLLSVILGTLIVATTMFFAAGSASAHDVAESSSPEQGATIATPPAKVSITYNNNPLPLGSQFKVNDSTGTDWADGGVEIVDNVVSQKLKAGGPAGAYTVVWRVVSSDSHPIEGTFGFTVTAGAEGSTAVAPVPVAGTAEPGTTTAPDASTVASPDAAQPFQWSLVALIVVAIGLLVALAIIAKRRLTPGAEDQPTEDEV